MQIRVGGRRHRCQRGADGRSENNSGNFVRVMMMMMMMIYSPKEENGLYVRCYQHIHYSLIRSMNLVLIKCASMTKWSISAL